MCNGPTVAIAHLKKYISHKLKGNKIILTFLVLGLIASTLELNVGSFLSAPPFFMPLFSDTLKNLDLLNPNNNTTDSSFRSKCCIPQTGEKLKMSFSKFSWIPLTFYYLYNY